MFLRYAAACVIALANLSALPLTPLPVNHTRLSEVMIAGLVCDEDMDCSTKDCPVVTRTAAGILFSPGITVSTANVPVPKLVIHDLMDHLYLVDLYRDGTLDAMFNESGDGMTMDSLSQSQRDSYQAQFEIIVNAALGCLEFRTGHSAI